MQPHSVGSIEVAQALHARIVAPMFIRPLFGTAGIAVPRYAAELGEVGDRSRTADYGKGAAARIDNGDGFPTFAELLVVHRLRAAGWTSAWASVFGGLRFIESWQWNEPQPIVHPLPPHVRKVIDKIAGTRQSMTNRTKPSHSGVPDVIAWRDHDFLLIECKRRNEDQMRRTQEEWFHSAVLTGLDILMLGIFEWGWRHTS